MSLSIGQIAAAIQELGIENEPLTRKETMSLLANMTETLRAIALSPAFLELTEHEEFHSDNYSVGDVIQGLDEILVSAERVNSIIERLSLREEFESGQEFYRWGEDCPPENVSVEFIRGWNSARFQASN